MSKSSVVRAVWLMGLAAVLSMVAVGCAASASKSGKGQLALARQYIEKEQYQPAVQVLSAFIEKESRRKEAATAYYLRGLAYSEMEPVRNDLAQEDFQQALEKAGKNKELGALAHVGLGHLYFESRPDEQEQAVVHYQAALEGLKRDDQTQAVVLYRLGAALQRLGRWQEADGYLSQTFDRFGESMYAGYARDGYGARAWRLQFGAFSGRERAAELVKALQRDGTAADWTVRQLEGKTLYAVQAGRYETYQEARQGLAAVHGQYPQTRIVAQP